MAGLRGGQGARRHLLQKVFRSCPHPHGFQDLLVQGSPLILQFAAASLCQGVTALREKEGCPSERSATLKLMTTFNTTEKDFKTKLL